MHDFATRDYVMREVRIQLSKTESRKVETWRCENEPGEWHENACDK